jgi:nucleotide-binding universal stress UspA family protein
VEEHDARALDSLNVASEAAGLVVVGSRGLRGVRALGSLSERLAHEARCSVLVVRGA